MLTDAEGHEISIVLDLIADGLSDSEIAQRTGIPRRNILDWRHGRWPARQRRAMQLRPALPLPNSEYAYLLGLYLGDGCLSATHRNGVWRLRIFADSRYPAIIDECGAAMEAIFPRQHAHNLQRRRSRCVEISMYSKHWPCLLPQHSAGRKHLRAIKLATWQVEIVKVSREPFLRGLIHSDGCRIIGP